MLCACTGCIKSLQQLALMCAAQESTPNAEQQELFKFYQDTMESAFKQHLADVGAGGKAASDGPVVSLQQLAQKLQEQGEGACDEEVR